MNDIRELGEALQNAYEAFKDEVRRTNRQAFERWKAGGYLVDSDIMSYYPNVEQLMEQLADDNEEE